jgi:hypothetical protein
MEVRMLGPVEVVSAHGPVPIGSAKQRARCWRSWPCSRAAW